MKPIAYYDERCPDCSRVLGARRIDVPKVEGHADAHSVLLIPIHNYAEGRCSGSLSRVPMELGNFDNVPPAI